MTSSKCITPFLWFLLLLDFSAKKNGSILSKRQELDLFEAGIDVCTLKDSTQVDAKFADQF